MAGNPNCGDLEQHPANKAVVIDGIRYPSQLEAAKRLKLHRNTVYRRLLRGEPGYCYADNGLGQ